MVSAQRNRGASIIAFSGIDFTPTPTNEEAFNGRRHNHKVEWIKLNNAEDDSNDTTTTQVEVEDKDEYYK